MKSLVLILLFLFPSMTYALNTVATGYRINNGGQAIINAHGVCQRVVNGSGKHIWVPTKTSGEWSNFRSRRPSGVSLYSCCGGYSYGGYCWYLAGNNQSCTSRCSSRGGCNAGGVNWAVNTSRCDNIVRNIGGTGFTAAVASGALSYGGLGCLWLDGRTKATPSSQPYVDTDARNCNGAYNGTTVVANWYLKRACPCAY